MRSFILPVCALTFLAMVYTAPIQNDADDCDVVGNCADEAFAHELTARSGENLFYGFPHNNNNNNVFYPNNIGGPGIVLVTETAVAATTVTEVVMTTVRPQSLPTPDSSSGSHGGLLNGLVDILTGSESHHGLAVPGALVPGLPLQSGASEVPGKVLPVIQQLTGGGSSEDNGITIKLSL